MLYQTYCNSCHTEQLHWRDKNIASDWINLVKEVGRWQSNANLDWTLDDVETAASYLNAHYYRYPLPKK